MVLLKAKFLDSALKFHDYLAFPNVVQVTRASVQKSHSEVKNVPKGKLGSKLFLTGEGK